MWDQKLNLVGFSLLLSQIKYFPKRYMTTAYPSENLVIKVIFVAIIKIKWEDQREIVWR